MAEILDETDLQILKTLQKNAKLTKNGWRRKVLSRSMWLSLTQRN